MKRRIIFFGMFIILVSGVVANAQTTIIRATLSKGLTPAGNDSVTITYTGLENPDAKVFEAVVPASAGSCGQNYNVQNVRLADPSVAAMSYDPVNGLYKLRWIPRTNTTDTCQVLFVAGSEGSVNAADYVVWRKTDGSATLNSDSNRRGPTIDPGASYTYTIDPRSID